MLLRASSQHVGESAELGATVGRGGDGGVAHGRLLVHFAESVTRGGEEMHAARSELRTGVGEAAFLEAASIVGIFNGLVRTADSTGIPLDENTLHTSKAFREELELNSFAGSASSPLDRADPGLVTSAGPNLPGRELVTRQFKS
jgi:hypothetical protein